MAAKKKEKTIALPVLKTDEMDVDVIGITSLLCHNFSDPTKQTILDKQMGKANKARATRDPLSDFVESIYYLNGTDKSVLLGELKNKKCWVGDNVADFGFNVKVDFGAAGDNVIDDISVEDILDVSPCLF